MNSQWGPAFEPGDLDCLAGGGEMGARMRAIDWLRSPVGPVRRWPRSLKTAVRIVLNSRYPMFIWWGRELSQFYNDAYIPMLGNRHPSALGRPAAETWHEIWDTVGPQADIVLNEDRATWNEELLLILERNGFPEEAYFTFSYSPVPDDAGGVGGVFCALTEDTPRVLNQRRLRTLRMLAERTTQAKTAEQACELAATALADNPHDLPFALLYLLDTEGGRATLAGATRMTWNTTASPALVELGDRGGCPWPFREVLQAGQATRVQDLPRQFGPLPGGAWHESPQEAYILPMARPGQDRPAGFLVGGLSPRLLFDDDYRVFMDLIAGHVAAAIANATAYQEERRRAEALAELDRAKTVFFSNVSHEFRTPLALMLGLAEDGLAEVSDSGQRERLEVIHRNGLRLQKLVNTLLDFSRIEAGRIQACYEPTDLAAFTRELACVFRSAVEKAGMRLTIDCPPLAEPIYVDHDLWEKIVLNLVSNAFKFTLQGEIEVSLRDAGDGVQLAVRDTGTGITEEQLPHIFERFHRVEGAPARTQEGTGIGLALVQELVKLHGGSVEVQSVFGQGSTFTVRIPKGAAHLPADRIGMTRNLASTALTASHYLEEALRWLPDDAVTSAQTDAPPPGRAQLVAADDGPAGEPIEGERPRIVWADDNADMRDYVRRLLSGRYAVEAVGDGEAALAAARRQRPDLVLTDMMMPRRDGFSLLQELRSDERTRTVPVIVLSARAGEEARIEGMRAGADDYLTKPFGARELLTRVDAAIRLAQVRREAEESLRHQHELMRTITDNASTAIFMMDAQGRCSFMNPAAEAMTGYRFEEIEGRRLHEVIQRHPPADGVSLPMQGFATRLAGLQGATLRGQENVFVRKDGTPFPVRCAASPIFKAGTLTGIVLEARDITEQKRAEEELRESEERFRNMADNAPVMVWISEPEGSCTFLSKSWYVFTGQAPGAGLGSGWVQAVHPDDRACARETFLAANARREPYRLECRLRHRDGQYRWAIGAASPRFGPDGRFLGYIGSVIDITDRRRMEEALREADRRKDEFLATLAHELRNPLAPIRNGLHILGLGAGLDPTAQHVLEIMERQVTHLVRLVDDLLEVSRITRGKIELRKERVEVAAVVRSAVETSKALIEAAHHELAVSLPPEPMILEADPVRLAQVVANLLNNAAKYTERGGRIWLTARREADTAAISVRDTGIGIPAEVLPKVFELFIQADRALGRAQGGLGIGLTLVRSLVEMHGGTVEARSAGRGKGSEFIVHLPLASGAGRAERDGRGGLRSPAVALSPRRILVVDDSRDAADSLGTLLTFLGAETRVAYDGPSALEVLRAYRPSVVLLDIGMPGMDGYEVARRMREEPGCRDMVLIALTGWGQEEDRRRSHAAGFDHHLVKPVDTSALQGLLASLPRHGIDGSAAGDSGKGA